MSLNTDSPGSFTSFQLPEGKGKFFLPVIIGIVGIADNNPAICDFPDAGITDGSPVCIFYSLSFPIQKEGPWFFTNPRSFFLFRNYAFFTAPFSELYTLL